MIDEIKSKTIKKKSNSLMYKTKAQLIDIILRKDDIEKSLRDTLKLRNVEHEKLIQDLDNFKYKRNELTNINSSLKNDYETICDEYALYRCESKITIKRLYIINIICVVFILLGIINIIFN